MVMKLVKSEKAGQREKVSFTIRLDKETLKKLNQVASDGSVSRQRLIESILKQVLTDKDFVLKIS